MQTDGERIALYTNLALVRPACALEEGARKLCQHAGRTWPADGLSGLGPNASIDLYDIFEALGPKTALWCLRVTLEQQALCTLTHDCSVQDFLAKIRPRAPRIAADLAEAVLPVFER